MVHSPPTEEERKRAARYGPRVYGAWLVLRAAGHGSMRVEPAIKIAKGRLLRK